MRNGSPLHDGHIMQERVRSEEAWSPAELERIRAQFPILRSVCYLNTGTYGPMPEPALEKLLEATASLERDGVASTHPFARDAEEVRSTLAEWIGAEPAEVAFTRNATDGINLVLAGQDWRPGDVVVTTDQEHEAMLHPLLYLQARRDIVVHRMPTTHDPDRVLEYLDGVASDALRMVAVSHVTCETGTRLPVEAICEWASRRGVLTLVDAAQSFGAVDVDVARMGCDYLAGNGHKWLHGPKGTGFLYARRERMRDLPPCHVGAGSLEHAEVATGEVALWQTGQRFEYGTRGYAAMTGWRESLTWIGDLGRDRIRSHIQAAAGWVIEALGRIRGVEILTPSEAPGRAGLVSFRVAGKDAHDVGRVLSDSAGIVSRHVPQQNAVRVSACLFTSLGDIETLEGAVRSALQS